MLQKIWWIVNFRLSLYNKTWDSPTLINLTNLTRGVRYCQVPNPFLLPGATGEGLPILNNCGFEGRIFYFFNCLRLRHEPGRTNPQRPGKRISPRTGTQEAPAAGRFANSEPELRQEPGTANRDRNRGNHEPQGLRTTNREDGNKDGKTAGISETGKQAYQRRGAERK